MVTQGVYYRSPHCSHAAPTPMPFAPLLSSLLWLSICCSSRSTPIINKSVLSIRGDICFWKTPVLASERHVWFAEKLEVPFSGLLRCSSSCLKISLDLWTQPKGTSGHIQVLCGTPDVILEPALVRYAVLKLVDKEDPLYHGSRTHEHSRCSPRA